MTQPTRLITSRSFTSDSFTSFFNSLASSSKTKRARGTVNTTSTSSEWCTRTQISDLIKVHLILKRLSTNSILSTTAFKRFSKFHQAAEYSPLWTILIISLSPGFFFLPRFEIDLPHRLSSSQAYALLAASREEVLSF